MSDVVQKRLELMTPEIEEMQRINLYSQDEIRKLLAKRKDFEYKIHSHLKSLESFTDYIFYEKCLLRDIQLRRNKFKCGEKKSEIEYSIMRRIKDLYKVALQRYPNELSLFYSFLEFCDRVHFVNAANSIISSMIKKHPDNPEVWLSVVKWHKNQRCDPKTAMNLLLKAVAIHKHNLLLNRELINWKINQINMSADSSQQDIYIKQLEKIIKHTFVNVKDCMFYIHLLEILEELPFAEQMLSDVKEYLKDYHSDNVVMWDNLAKNSMKEFFNENTSDTQKEEMNNELLVKQLETCIATYKEGLDNISENQKPKLLELYVNYLLVLQDKLIDNESNSIIKHNLNKLYEAGYLHEKHLLKWLKNVSQKEALDVVKQGCKSNPNSVKLWTVLLKLLIKHGKSEIEIEDTFQLGIAGLKDNAFPLWKLFIEYHCQKLTDSTVIEQIYMKGISSKTEKVCTLLKLHYLEWVYKNKDINCTRQTYKKLSTLHPFSIVLHNKMIKIELSQEENEKAGEVYVLACDQFGKIDVDVWINYMCYIINGSETTVNKNKKVVKLRNQAFQTLSQDLHELFTRKYCSLLQTI